MKKDKGKMLKGKEWSDVSQVANTLKVFTEKLESGKITFTKGEEEVEVEIPSKLRFGIRAREKETKKGISRKITVSIRWTEGSEEDQQVDIK